MRAAILTASCVVLLQATALAAPKTGIRFWNLTGETLAEVSLAPAGTTKFGPNQCLNDKDGTVEFDEDLLLKGVAPALYDIRMKDVKGRTCYARSVSIKANATFSVGEKELKDCVP